METIEIAMWCAIVILIVIGFYSALLNYWMWKAWNKRMDDKGIPPKDVFPELTEPEDTPAPEPVYVSHTEPEEIPPPPPPAEPETREPEEKPPEIELVETE